MSRDRNVFLVVGRLGADPEMRYTPAGTAVTNFVIANSDDYYDKSRGEWVDRTHWLRFVAYGDLAERVAKLSKGDAVDVLAKVTNNNYTNKEGKKVYKDEYVAREVIVLSRNGKSGGSGGNTAASTDGDEIPF